MTLSTYTDLIRVLPYKEQSFKTNKETWVKYCGNNEFDKYCAKMFVLPTIEISRGDLFGKIRNEDFSSNVYSIILWGYPNGYTRPNTMSKLFPQFLKSLPDIEKLIKENISKSEFIKLLNVKGIGLSTLTKILYFLQIRVEGFQSLILDSRIIKVLQSKRFEELKELSGITEFSKYDYYTDYIRLLSKISNEYDYKADQLELFLFMFGNNLKG